MKYNFTSMGRLILPCYGASLGLAILSKIFLLISKSLSRSYSYSDNVQLTDFLAGILSSIAVFLGILIFAIVLLILFFTIRNFYFTFSSKNGYLSFSLPVSANQHLLSHLLVSVIYIIGSFLVTCLSLAILFFEQLKEVPAFFQSLAQANSIASFWKFIVLVLIFSILGIFTSQMQFYSAIAIGSQFKKSRVAGSVLGYFIIYMIRNFISAIVTAFSISGIMNSYSNTYDMFDTVQNIFDFLFSFLLRFTAPALILGLILFLAEYFFCKYIFTKRLNLV